MAKYPKSKYFYFQKESFLIDFVINIVKKHSNRLLFFIKQMIMYQESYTASLLLQYENEIKRPFFNVNTNHQWFLQKQLNYLFIRQLSYWQQ